MNEIITSNYSSKTKNKKYPPDNQPLMDYSKKFISIQELFKIGNAFHKDGEISHAETIFRQILDVAPNHPGALHFLGVIARQCGNLESSINLINNGRFKSTWGCSNFENF